MRKEAIENQAAEPPPLKQFPEGYMGKRQLARQLGRTVRSIDTYMALGVIPFYKLGRTVMFKWSEVDQHIQAHFRVCLRNK
jgi:hypothetical protein